MSVGRVLSLLEQKSSIRRVWRYKDDRIKLIKYEFLGEGAWNKNSKGSRDCGDNTVG